MLRLLFFFIKMQKEFVFNCRNLKYILIKY